MSGIKGKDRTSHQRLTKEVFFLKLLETMSLELELNRLFRKECFRFKAFQS